MEASFRCGDKFRDEKGYVRVFLPDHPHSSKGFVYEHRLIVEKAIGRYLETGETVHHINEVKHDNRILNLYLCTPEEHVMIHSRGVKRSQEQNKKIRQTIRENEKNKKLQKRKQR